MTKRAFIAVEDVYAVHALRRLIASKRTAARSTVVAHLPPCSSKMSRVIHAQLKQGARVVVLIDAEDGDPREKEEWLRHIHNLGPEIEIIVFDPCIEAPLCEALGLRNCREKPCRAGPLRSVDEYWHRTRGRGYAKRLLPLLLLEAEARGRLDSTPEFRRLLGWLRRG